MCAKLEYLAENDPDGNHRGGLSKWRIMVLKLDGVAFTQPNANGVLVWLLIEAGFPDVRKLK